MPYYRQMDINHHFRNQMAGAVRIELTYHGSEPSVIAVIRNPNKMVERQRLGLCMLPSSADAVYPNSLQIRHSAKSDTDRFVVLFVPT